MGLGHRLGRRRAVDRVLRHLSPWHHHRLPPRFHPRLLHAQPTTEDRDRNCGQPCYRGPGRTLGGRPPQAPRIQRCRRGPALPLALWRIHARPAQGILLRPHRLALRSRADPHREVRAGSAQGQGPRTRFAPVPPVGRGESASARDPGRPAHVVMDGSRDRLLLGVPRAHRPGPPHDMVDQLGVPRLGQAPLQDPRPFGQCGLARDPVRRGVLAQPAPQ
ncbi:unannotated protein [freshwater metagenome]|uniref:Unannotated protein n=1 Tax=freshwater metagenome TaxID=449393 RepID=A0A6J7C520_9ZZZZ